MIFKFIKSLKALFQPNSEFFLKEVKGIIHVGANTGQEAAIYAKYGLPVIWIEPNPEVFNILEKNILQYPNQKAIKGLITDIADKAYEFHLANNDGESSSIFDFNLHKDIWPTVHFENTIVLKSETLPLILDNNNVNLSQYDMLIMDTQGSELLVLKGAEKILSNFKFIKTEVPDFEAYKNCCQLVEIADYLTKSDYHEVYRNKFASRKEDGGYYDIIYKKNE